MYLRSRKDEIILTLNKDKTMKNINVKDLATAFSFNYDYMRRMFKEKTGKTCAAAFAEYAEALNISQA